MCNQNHAGIRGDAEIGPIAVSIAAGRWPIPTEPARVINIRSRRKERLASFKGTETHAGTNKR